ncbi:MAG: glycosyltransferase, partial [Bacteroidales bacterium]
MQPKITIVTVTYNCAKVLQATIDSVVHQTYPNIEYILVDGASTDGTVEIIQQ